MRLTTMGGKIVPNVYAASESTWQRPDHETDYHGTFSYSQANVPAASESTWQRPDHDTVVKRNQSGHSKYNRDC
jgi:hypothetical protein